MRILDGSATVIHLGPLPIHVWGLFVAAGFILVTWLTVRRASREGVDPKAVADLAVWILIASFVGARIVHVVLYEPAYYLANPVDILKIWEGGLSSLGGFTGAFLAAIAFTRRRRIPLASLAALVLSVLPFGYAVGRLGCHVTRMHPGIPYAGWLGVAFPDGVRRLDLGLLEALLWLAIALGLAVFGEPLRRRRLLVPFVLDAYGTGRLILDFFRVADARYFGLTPAQYGAIVLMLVAGWIMVRETRRPGIT